MKIDFYRIEPDALVPTRSHESDAGLDLYAYDDFELYEECSSLVRTGIAIDIPHGYVGLVWPRSGLAARHSIDTLAGVIDAGYHGEIMVNVINHSRYKQVFNKGDRIAQLLVQQIELPILNEVSLEEFGASYRGTSGHGSTGS